MIQFEPLLSPLFAWIAGFGLILILIFQFVQIHQGSISLRRKRIKQVLNSFLVVLLLGFMLQPKWNNDPKSGKVLIFSEQMKNSEINFWKDSLSINRAVQASKFDIQTDSVILLGLDFPKEFLYGIRAKSLNWIIPEQENAPIYLEWKGILSHNERQIIRGKWSKIPENPISLWQEGTELELSDLITKQAEFEFQFPASIPGRNNLKLKIGEEVIGIIRFFVLPKEKLIYQIQTGFPGPETRALNRFLISEGEKVQEKIQLSKATELLTEILPLDSVDVLVIDPSQMDDTRIQKRIESGASLLLVNLSEVDEELKTLNRIFGTDFEIQSTGESNPRKLENELEALPFQFQEKAIQEVLFENSIAVQRTGNSKIGVSLLSSTFAIAQSGDTLKYEEIWSQILGELRPENPKNWNIQAPVYLHQFQLLKLNERDTLNEVILGTDTLNLTPSLINPDSKSINFVSLDTGWVKLDKETEFYISPKSEIPYLFNQKERAEFLQTKSWEIASIASEQAMKTVPFWLWGLLILLNLTGLWIEPKWDEI